MRMKTEVRQPKSACVGLVHSCSAELHSAVSPNCIRQGVRLVRKLAPSPRAAECNSAIRQIGNLRYFFSPRQALLHFQSSGAAHNRAFTGLFIT